MKTNYVELFLNFLENEGALDKFLKNITISFIWMIYFKEKESWIAGAFVWINTEHPSFWIELNEKWLKICANPTSNDENIIDVECEIIEPKQLSE